MSQESEPDTPFSPGRLSGATNLFSLQQNPGQLPQEYVTAVSLLDLRDIRSDLKQDIDDARADVETNAEQQAFMALPPTEANHDSVGAESQFPDYTPRAPGGPNLRTQLTELSQFMDVLKIKITENSEQFFHDLNNI
jgi:hypothetical protein